MQQDWQQARQTLSDAGYTCVLCKDGQLYTSTQRGVAPLLGWLKEGALSPGFCAADKVVGRATAFLYCLLGARAVYAGVMSQGALAVLQQHGILTACDKTVEYIRNQTNDGMCPMESATLSVAHPEDALRAIEQALEKLRS